MNASYNKGIIDIMARNEEDMINVEKVAKYLVEEFGYEEIAGDDETIILENSGCTIAECKKHYKEAKKAA